MKNDTPTTDQWEAYCDECYYHMWRLRRKTERGWHDGFHVHTGAEAKGLCDLLNNLERERDEARDAANKAKAYKRVLKETNAQLKRERDEARAQRDRLAKALRECREDSVELLGERDWWQHEPRGDYQQRYQETRHNAKRADAALQSLTTNATLSNQ